MCVRITVYTCNTVQNSSDSVPSYPADKHHCSDVVNWRREHSNVVMLVNSIQCERAVDR